MSRIRVEKKSAEELLALKRAAQDAHYAKLKSSGQSGRKLAEESFSGFKERFRKSKISF